MAVLKAVKIVWTCPVCLAEDNAKCTFEKNNCLWAECDECHSTVRLENIYYQFSDDKTIETVTAINKMPHLNKLTVSCDCESAKH
jgi:hypothetical protein